MTYVTCLQVIWTFCETLVFFYQNPGTIIKLRFWNKLIVFVSISQWQIGQNNILVNLSQKLTELGRKEIVYIVIWTLYNEKCSGFLKHSGSNIYEDPMAVCKVRIFEAILFCLSRYFNQNFFHLFFYIFNIH